RRVAGPSALPWEEAAAAQTAQVLGPQWKRRISKPMQETNSLCGASCPPSPYAFASSLNSPACSTHFHGKGGKSVSLRTIGIFTKVDKVFFFAIRNHRLDCFSGVLRIPRH